MIITIILIRLNGNQNNMEKEILKLKGFIPSNMSSKNEIDMAIEDVINMTNEFNMFKEKEYAYK